MVIALILAGGLGKRVGTEVPKQFLKINDVPVIAYTLKKFQECNKVDRICVVSHHDWIETVKKVIDKFITDYDYEDIFEKFFKELDCGK